MLLVDILHQDVEWLGCAMNLWLELKVGSDGKLDAQDRPRDWLHVRRELEPWELMHEPMDHLAHLGEADELANLLRLQIVEALPREVLLLNLLDNILRDTLELPQWALREPHSPIDHLAEAQHTIGQARPTALQHDLVDAAHQATGRLRNVDHIRQQ